MTNADYALPDLAEQAADDLAAEGAHVHLVSNGDAICHSGHCAEGEGR
ncbi:hypothetical protein [Streptomyces sp. SCSIO ZS0520]|nr:hypothetical protein [Streptomyces sp. SCSIO ZS0520]